MKHKTFEFLLCFRAWGKARITFTSFLNLQFLGDSKKQQKPTAPTNTAVPSGLLKAVGTALSSWPSQDFLLPNRLFNTLQKCLELCKCEKTHQALSRGPPCSERMQGSKSKVHFSFSIKCIECTGFSNWITALSAVSANPIITVIKGVSKCLLTSSFFHNPQSAIFTCRYNCR